MRGVRTTDLAELQTRWLTAVDGELEAALRLRREVHADPRLSGNEEDTAARVEKALGLTMERVAETGRVGRIGPATGPSVLVRGELDALPVVEETGADCAATNGAMHACGHDVHLAALIAVVRAAAGLDLPLGLVPLLQPREETYPSGARDAVEEGALSRWQVGAAVGAHVHPAVPPGAVATGGGVVNAAADEIRIELSGRGGHGAYPHRAADTVAALAHSVLALQEVVRRHVSPMRPATLSVGHVSAGAQSANVLPERALALATLRTTDATDREVVLREVRRAVESQARVFGVTAEVDVVAGEPVLENDPGLVECMDRWLVRSGAEPTEPMRSLGADDFSYFCEQVPSVMAFVGVTVAGHVEPPQLHTATFLPTDDAVRDVARAMVAGYLGAVERLVPPET
ncbi:M20 metallopeptidase family protein [Kytococcus sp. Marseille-QA3725]